jgi:hypothetical protein
MRARHRAGSATAGREQNRGEQDDLDKTHPKNTDEENSIFRPAKLRGFQIGGDRRYNPSIQLGSVSEIGGCPLLRW